MQPRSPRRLRTRAGLILAAGALATASLAFVGTSGAGASATSCAVPEDGLGFHATFKNGTLKLGSATATGLAADACGFIVANPDGTLVSTVQPGDIAFTPVSVKILFLSLPSTVTVNAPLSGPVQIGPAFDSADISLTANLSAAASLLGFKCTIGPLTPTLTTGTSGSLTGTTFTGDLTSGFSGKVVANSFAVPAIKSSSSCPGLIAGLSNLLVGLPAKPGKASIQMEGSITVG